MKKTLFALAFAGMASSAFAIGETGESGLRYLDYVKMTGQNQAAYLQLSSNEWGAGTYTIDLSGSNPYGKEMLSLALSAINTGRQISFTVDTVAGGSFPNCSRSGATPVCSFGARIKQLWLHK